MLQKKLKPTALLVLTLLATMATAQTVNMNRYITLTVVPGRQIQLQFQAAAANTGVKIVSGSTDQTITVGTSWIVGYYTTGASSMTIYGDITGFNCNNNSNGIIALNLTRNTLLTMLDCGSNRLSSLDVSQNTALKSLRCHNNRLVSLDVSKNTVLTGLDCNKNQLTALNLTQNTALKKLICCSNNFTTQAFNELMCSLPTRTTGDNAEFYPLNNAFDANAAAFMATNARIATGKNWKVRYDESSTGIPATTGTYTCLTANMSKYITLTVQQGQQIQLDLKAAAAGTKVKVVSGSTETEVTVGTDWTDYRNYTAGAGTMTVYGDIIGFDCSDNGTKLTALDVSHNTALTRLYCQNNQLTSLNVSQNTALTELGCYDNQLTALDVSQNTALTWLLCSGNNFTTKAFNDLMCSLPARTAADDAKFYPLDNASDAGASAFMAANSQIATGKNWQVRYGAGGEIPVTTGTYTCPVVNMSRYITLTVQQGQQIRLNFLAATDDTKVKVVSGAEEAVVTVGTIWAGYQNFTAGSRTMTIYGDITEFDCGGNEAKLTALDVSQNTALTRLECYHNRLTALDLTHNTALTTLVCLGNNFTIQAFNDLMCSLPARVAADDASFYPLRNASDAATSTFMATNSQIATSKNWQVRYWIGSEYIPATNGTYVCGTGIEEITAVPLSVYPNPATDILTIETEDTGATITITDLTGCTVLTATATAGKTTLHIAHLSAGAYVVRVGDKIGKVVKR